MLNPTGLVSSFNSIFQVNKMEELLKGELCAERTTYIKQCRAIIFAFFIVINENVISLQVLLLDPHSDYDEEHHVIIPQT